MSCDGRVYLVGAGPGDPELITVKGRRLLANADVVLYDRLVAPELLDDCRPDAELVNVGKTPRGPRTPQHEINALLVAHARAGRVVVRLKGGDPFVYGRGGEELLACRAAGVRCDVVPGVSSALAVPAAVGAPVTHRGVARSAAIITGHTDGEKLPDYDYAALTKLDTLIVLMGLSNLRALTAALLAAGRDPDVPAASIAAGTLPEQRHVVATLATLADAVADADLRGAVTTIIGPTAALAAGSGAAIATAATAAEG